jgi:hypothetical protein
MVREEERGVDEKDWEEVFFLFLPSKKKPHLVWLSVKIKIENCMVEVKFKFLLNVISFLSDQEPEEKYRVVCPKELDKNVIKKMNICRIRTQRLNSDYLEHNCDFI